MAKAKAETPPPVERRTLTADFVEECLAKAEAQTSALSDQALAVPGMTSPEVRHLLNSLCSEGADYCEIGTLLGATAVAASYNNTGFHVALDNFSQWPDVLNLPSLGAVSLRDVAQLSTRDAWQKYVDGAGCKVRLVLADVHEWEPDLTTDILFYDGDHSEDGTRRALSRLVGHMKPSLVIVDDWDSVYVQAGTRAAGLNVVQEWTRNWWRGIYLALVG